VKGKGETRTEGKKQN